MSGVLKMPVFSETSEILSTGIRKILCFGWHVLSWCRELAGGWRRRDSAGKKRKEQRTCVRCSILYPSEYFAESS